MIEELLTGLRLSLIILWVTAGFRVALVSWDAALQPEPTRRWAWAWWRGSVILQAIAIVLFYSPADLLLAAHLIEHQGAVTLRLLGTLFNNVAVIALLTGLDVSNGTSWRGVYLYSMVSLAGLSYGLTGA